ncbi:hypothetical protein ACSNN9_02635 [Micromonospora sp. URMC 107]|uniref:hypothetical protein n=1 Tax=Micromonospora sp. URMC 107 TaxID=3423418 RepID=UPI003F1A07F9
MESHWIDQRPGYRCRHGHTSTQPTAGARSSISGKTTSSQGSPSIPSGIQTPHDLVTLPQRRKVTIVCDQEHLHTDHRVIRAGRPARIMIDMW